MENIEKMENPEFDSKWYNSFIERSNEKEALVSKINEIIKEKSGKCLEIGLGTKPIFASKIAKAFEKYFIIEKATLDNLSLSKNINIITGDWESIELNQKFDVILASHVIYYFKNKKRALEKMFAHLNKGGILILVVNGTEGDYGSTKKFFAKKLGKNYEFTYDHVLDLLKNKNVNEHNLLTKVSFKNLEDLHGSLRLFFDTYPREYEFFKEDLLDFWKFNLNDKNFIINQKIIELSNKSAYRDKFIGESKTILMESQKEKEKYYINVGGKKFVVYPQVFSPKYFSDTRFFCKVLPIKKGEKVLEIGCGTGVLSIFAAFSGAEIVYSTDINPMAVKNTAENATLHGLSDRIKVSLGDVYESVPGNVKFNAIIWNGPFLYTEENNIAMLEKSILDKDYESLKKTIAQAKDYLAKDGRLLIGFSTTIGRIDLLNKFLKDSGFEVKEIFKMQAPLGNPEVTSQNYQDISFELFEASRAL